MKKFLREHKYLYFPIGGLIFSNILAFIQLVCEIPRGNIIGVLGFYGFFIPLIISLILLGRDLFVKRKTLSIFLFVISAALTVGIIIDLVGLIFSS